MFLAATTAQGQITIGGNVYGGGNEGNTGLCTTVKVYAGDISGSVFGGARMANVGGCSYVNIDGESMTDNIIIDHVYGGNDISGTIGSLEDISSDKKKPDDRLDSGNHHSDTSEEGEQDNHGSLKSVNAFVLTTPERNADYHLFIGELYGGSNGDYPYILNTSDYSKYDLSYGDISLTMIDKPDVARTYVDIHGGTFGYVYAGGNNVTVTDAANICIKNKSTAPTKVSVTEDTDNDEGVIVKHDRLLAMGINTEYFDNHYLFSRVFGGNNQATMRIRPVWHLTNGSIENLYSGGDEGSMTNPDGILLVVKPELETDHLEIKNVFAGCRKANVTPLLPNGQPAIPGTIDTYKFPTGLAARVLIYGGDITNVYGGNDITGKVTGGSAIGIYSSIKGDVYGGGNGSYAYTDNKDLINTALYGDFYYDVNKLNGADEDHEFTSVESANALNKFRPNAEQVSLRVYGGDPDDPNQKPTIIGGAIYLGGNSATLLPTEKQKQEGYMIELKIGSNVYADKVFLANNGEHMIDEDILRRYAGTVIVDGVEYDYSKMDLTNTVEIDEDGKNAFAKYMDGVVMEAGPQVVFDNKDNDDPATYKNYSTYFGSFYCGGNIGSMRNNATTEINFFHKVIIFNKLVGGSNKANVPARDGLNCLYKGGLLGTPPTTGENAGVKLKLNLRELKIQPKRWVDENDKSKLLEWNTVNRVTGEKMDPVTEMKPFDEDKDFDRRFVGGNIYGGCYESGHVNGDVVINIDGSIIDRDGKFGVFDSVKEDKEGEAILYGHDSYEITERRSGVILDEQGMDVLGLALNLFGGGYGVDSEVWGKTTINLNKGYVFQIFGGSEKGVIGKSTNDGGTGTGSDYTFNGKTFKYNPDYSTTINVHGDHVGASKQSDRSEDLAECEFIYGGGFEGPIVGNTRINLGNGRVFNTFAGSCNADILGHTETYIGQWTVGSGESVTTITGFPWVRDYTYGGNDLGGNIMGSKSFEDYLNEGTLVKVHNPEGKAVPDVLSASAYTEYKQGRVLGIFGGCYGSYDYNDDYYTSHLLDADGHFDENRMPRMHNAFVNISPLADSENNKANFIESVYGAGQGYSGERRGDKMQDRSYVLIDIPTTTTKFKDLSAFGGGAYNGIGMRYAKNLTTTPGFDLDEASAVVDLISGQINAAYGGSYQEGITRRTLVNVPAASEIKLDKIFGGAYGTNILPPCDVYESNVNYKNTTQKASVNYIFGGNNNERRTLYAKVNITSPVWSDKEKGYLATVYGAGRGLDTWAEYTEVNLENGAKVWEVFGGGQMGHVLNSESVQKYMKLYKSVPSAQIAASDAKWGNSERWEDDIVGSTLKPAYLDEWSEDWMDAWTIGDYFEPNSEFSNYIGNDLTNLSNSLVRTADMDDRDYITSTDALYKKYNTNVIIKAGATVENYAYGGGWGESKTPLSGDVYGTTYIALLGGTVAKDLYAAGTSGGVYDLFGVGIKSESNSEGFTASANAYVEGGTVRNVYGGGWKGNVGMHTGTELSPMAGSREADLLGETHVVVGIHEDQKTAIEGEYGAGSFGFLKGDPAIQRNAYGGGEGGAVFGTANLTIYNGHIGYIHLNDGEMLNDRGEVVSAPAPPVNPAEGYVYPYVERYEELVDDETNFDKNKNWIGKNTLKDSGCAFGGGYIDNSTVDFANVTMYGGTIRNSLFGGGEIAAIGRGVYVGTQNGNNQYNIYKGGKTTVKLYDGFVRSNVFGGGRGYNNLGDGGTLDTDGYVFGQTEVNIYGGEVGNELSVEKGDGNVFGGGDIGYVYSAHEGDDGKLYVGIKDGERYDDGWEGYYYDYKVGTNGYTPGTKPADNDENWVTENNEYVLTEDCKVLVEPHCKVTADVSINGKSYTVGQYVSTDALHHLKKKALSSEWASLDDSGIIIHNAVFAGGNVASGSEKVHANAFTVYGNATASIHDVYHRDLITIGTGHTGGLYGDGNLTFVDGYRGLNITNYGTDYYNIEKQITIGTYKGLPARERAYYEVRYKCLVQCTDDDGKLYSVGSTISYDEFLAKFENQSGMFSLDAEGKSIPNPEYWEENGVCSRYAGRIMNTIQRADFCGVFGSRMVMQGAQDRVPETVDYTNYTINRVREVSLNKKVSVIDSDYTTYTAEEEAANAEHKAGTYVDPNSPLHGNYFGIYNIVNFLGALTSDVDFHTGKRTTDANLTENPELAPVENQTFEAWKEEHINEQTRNNGSSYNKVALASGVFLELTTEKSTGNTVETKDWGYITGVIELDLINVQPGIGGGFVYAKNVHGDYSYEKKYHVTLTKLNMGAVTRKDYTYTYPGDQKQWQTSGNFIHSTQTIIDDCYPVSNRYGEGGVPAHYWYIKGMVYVYDQYISAYTGVPNAYSETVNLPLTITAASNGKMKLLNVQPNYYAYYSSYTDANTNTSLEGSEMVLNEVTYHQNDPISYWDYYMLSPAERKLFVPKTYVTVANCTIGEGENPVAITSGKVLLPGVDDGGGNYPVGTYNYYYNLAPSKSLRDGEEPVKYVHNTATDQDVPFTEVFRSSNNMGHDTGFILTYDVTNPKEWTDWYMPKEASSGSEPWRTDKKSTEYYSGLSENDKKLYDDGPTYRLKVVDNMTARLLGQRTYKIGDVISEETYNTYEEIKDDEAKASSIPSTGQAIFEKAWIVVREITDAEKYIVDENGVRTSDVASQNMHVGAVVAQSEFTPASWSGKISKNVVPAYVCTSTITFDKDKGINVLINDRMTATDIANYKTEYPDMADVIDKNIVPGYYCTTKGLYGGNYYQTGENYRGLQAWSSMSEDDREFFDFNYDALDLLIDPSYGLVEGHKYQYDGYDSYVEGNKDFMIYSLPTPVDYKATYNGSDDDSTDGEGKNYMATTVEGIGNVYVGDELSREQYEQLPNEQRHYSRLNVTDANTSYYVVNTLIQEGDVNYAVGSIVSEDVYKQFPSSVTHMKFASTGIYYYCRDSYPKGVNVVNVAYGESGITIWDAEGNDITSTADTKVVYDSSTSSDDVPVGLVISGENYNYLPNQQKNFTIHGTAPIETSTLFVSRNSDISDLSTEKIITVIYQYDYEQSNADGSQITPVTERHVVNIHITFESGVPTVEDISAPKIVLPGTGVSLREPHVTPGASEVTGGGWELFNNLRDAESHSNGVEYSPATDVLYWYQDDYYLAYYATSYIGGKTYSNNVQVSVANYHDLSEVMADKNKKHHMYIDNTHVKRAPKIYINDYSEEGKNGVDLLKNLYDLSMLSSKVVKPSNPLYGHSLLDSHVRGGENLEFFLRTNIDHSDAEGNPLAWEPIAGEKNESGDYTGCFEGKLHGDGYYISGLSKSLFGKLCGDVYNLGVMGSFTSAGVADAGEGYVANCWVKSTVSALPELASKGKAVFAYNESDPGVHIMNSYYPESNTALYNTTDGVRMMPDKAFYNGEVAYNLNGYYLNKRYYDHNQTTAVLGEAPKEYSYYVEDEDTDEEGNPILTKKDDKKYGEDFKNFTYVEERFLDGDFIYADHSIPEGQNERAYSKVVNGKTVVEYYPIWPHDYIFFGQALNYGHVNGRTHQDVPSHIAKSSDRIDTDVTGNRVYRAPAYFRSSKMGVAHFNPYAVFAATKKGDTSVKAYKDMTAIDFTGYNDANYAYLKDWQKWSKTSQTLQSSKKSDDEYAFFPPLLDDGGVNGFVNADLTRNLLAYTEASTITDATVSTALSEAAYQEGNATGDGYVAGKKNYRTVAFSDPINIFGHWIQKSGDDYKAQLDHQLVDKQDFNAPIAYTFGTFTDAEDVSHGYRMWYQRDPDNFAGQKKAMDTNGNPQFDLDAGWESISLPFAAELVTTNVKGEITHFYGSSIKGHEYWLREFTGKEARPSGSDTYVAKFTYPDATTGTPKTVTNTFLWDYYYLDAAGHNQQDKNDDTYQAYYQMKDVNTNDVVGDEGDYVNQFTDYKQLQRGIPYIIGFPGERYYEFDLSGGFKAHPTTATYQAETPKQLLKQTITFASNESAEIAVSDGEMTGVLHDGYRFYPNYLNIEMPEGGYVMSADGDAFNKLTAADVTAKKNKVSAFRTYFSTSATPQQAARRIMFSNSGSQLGGDEKPESQDNVAESMEFSTKKHAIVVTSHMRNAADVGIYSVSGVCVASFDIQPGETIETPVNASGVYIIRAAGGHYTKKITLK